jgi:hypothetical protein
MNFFKPTPPYNRKLERYIGWIIAGSAGGADRASGRAFVEAGGCVLREFLATNGFRFRAMRKLRLSVYQVPAGVGMTSADYQRGVWASPPFREIRMSE